MGDIIVSLAEAENWDLVYDEVIYAGRVGGGYIPIAPFDLPVLAHSSLLLCYAENIDAKPWWYLGCRLHQQIETAISPGIASGRFAKVPINRPALLRFPLYAPQYSLRCEIPPWFDRMKIAIWEYSAPIGDSTEQLVQDSRDLIRIDLIRIETKVDNL